MEVRLPARLRISIPTDWWLLGPREERLIATMLEAAIDISDVEIAPGGQVLIAANSVPRTTFASVRVTADTPPSYNAREISSMNLAAVRSLANEARTGLTQLLPLQGLAVLEFYGVRADSIAGYPALVTEYRRTGSRGPVFVQQNIILTPTRDIAVTLSYRESERALWMPVIGRIRASLMFQ